MKLLLALLLSCSPAYALTSEGNAIAAKVARFSQFAEERLRREREEEQRQRFQFIILEIEIKQAEDETK